MATNGVIADRQLREGETILVILAAANPNPDEFDIRRATRRIFTFGVGPHACPGQMRAESIAASGVEQLLISGFDPKSIAGPTVYRPSANTRIPLWIS